MSRFRCFFPQADTQLKKALCMGTGVTLLGFSGFCGKAIIDSANDGKINKGLHALDEKMHTSRVQDAIPFHVRWNNERISWERKEFWKGMAGFSGGLILGIFFPLIAYMERHRVTDYFKRTYGETECCVIIRRTMFSPVVLAPFILAFVFTSFSLSWSLSALINTILPSHKRLREYKSVRTKEECKQAYENRYR